MRQTGQAVPVPSIQTHRGQQAMEAELNQAAFAEWMERIRHGDQQAAAELVRRYEGEIRREARLRLRDPRLRRVLDSMDICQSVLANFFARAGAGSYQLDNPQRLVRLLAEMARNKVAGVAQFQNAQKRDARRVAPESIDQFEIPASSPTPSQTFDAQELREQIRSQLGQEEQVLLDLRLLNYEWSEIAAQVGGTPVARRMQLKRALDRANALNNFRQWI